MGKLTPILFATVLAGCATAGTEFQWETARKVTVGMTEAQVVAIMGKPNSVATKGDEQVWVWIYVSSSVISGVVTRRVSFSMKDGKVTAVPNLTQF